jgi:hypothetical protein
VRNSVGTAVATALRTGDVALLTEVQSSFMHALHIACVVGAAVCWLGAIGALLLPGRARAATATPRTTLCGQPRPAQFSW